MKPRDFKTHATYFNLLSPVSELSDYRILQVRGSHGNAYYAGKYSINCSLVVIVRGTQRQFSEEYLFGGRFEI